jgi:tRNA(Phe) wybutosine-synthesizing methylase Tyw3
MRHQQVPVKVNALVDRGVSTLVKALNEFPNVATLSSCEGKGRERAFVAFTIPQTDWKQTGDFVAKLSNELGEVPGLADATAFSLSLEWYAGGDVPSAYLRVPRRGVERLASAIKNIAASKTNHRAPRP